MLLNSARAMRLRGVSHGRSTSRLNVLVASLKRCMGLPSNTLGGDENLSQTLRRYVLFRLFESCELAVTAIVTISSEFSTKWRNSILSALPLL